MIKAKDFILDPSKLENEYQLVEVSKWTDYDTGKQVGLTYSVLFPKLQFEKIKINVKSSVPIIANDELEKNGQISVKFDNLTVKASLYQGRLSAKGEADSIKRVDNK